MSPAELETRLARSLDHYKVRRTQGEDPRPEEYREELGEAYEDFVEILELERMLDEVLELGPEEALPREFGPYTLLRVLGRGGAGTVYEGVHRDLGRHEAVKVLHAGFSDEGTALERFRHEAKVLARVHHDHIVEIYGAGQVDGRPYYAMTLLDGRPLSEVARSGQLPSPEDLARGLADVADALHMLHEQGVVHRDVTPANVFLLEDGRMVLSDFGLARSLEDTHLTRTGQALGTPLYMSPEQILARRDEIDPRTDVYGLGATLYTVLAGRPVFASDDLRALYQMILGERPEPLEKVAPDVPPGCARIAMTALEKRPADRYATAAEMAEDLRRFAAGKKPRRGPVSNLVHVIRALRRHPLPVAAALLAALGAIYLWATRTGTLSVTSAVAGVHVFVDGEDWGDAPLSRDVEPGTYDVVMRHERYEESGQPVDVRAWGTCNVIFPLAVLKAKNPDDPTTLKELDTALELAAAPLPPSGERSPPKVAFKAVAVLPAGRVRRQDLGLGYAEFPTRGDTEGFHLVFERTRDGVRETIYDRPFLQGAYRAPFDLPPDMLRQLEPGDHVTWGFRRAETATADRTFEVVEDDPQVEAVLARIDRDLAAQDEGVRAGFRAKALLAADLPLAAFEEARRVTTFQDLHGTAGAKRHEGEGLAWAYMLGALHRMDPKGMSKLQTVVSERTDLGILEAFEAGAGGG